LTSLERVVVAIQYVVVASLILAVATYWLVA
jgi:hypothetical protein